MKSKGDLYINDNDRIVVQNTRYIVGKGVFMEIQSGIKLENQWNQNFRYYSGCAMNDFFPNKSVNFSH